MSAATTAPRPSPHTPWSPPSTRVVSSSSPSGFPVRTPAAANSRTPGASQTLSPPPRGPLHPSSPNYFEYIRDPDVNPPNSNAGIYAKRNWSPSSTGDGPKPAEPAFQPLESQKRYENFKRKSESNTFRLNRGSLGHGDAIMEEQDLVGGDGGREKYPRRQTGSGLSPKSTPAVPQFNDENEAMQIDPPDDLAQVSPRRLDVNGQVQQGQSSPSATRSGSELSNLPRSRLANIDERHPRNSLPDNRAESMASIQRSETLPTLLKTEGPTFIPPQEFDEISKNCSPSDLLLLDLRVSHQYAKSRIADAINLCIPTTLIKRASYNTQKLSASLTKESDRALFDQWQNAKVIAVYDASASQISDATCCVNILKKFTQEGWQGATFIIRGGFNALSKAFPDRVDIRPASELHGAPATGLNLKSPIMGAPVSGGCEMPKDQKAAMPFFGTIRQNMDLIGGVGQMPVMIPARLRDKSKSSLPMWLKKASDAEDKGKRVADRFLKIEKEEQYRMKKALSTDVSHGTPNPSSPNRVQVAGIEKGMKNRYKDILPYDHSRVRLQDVPAGGCDYVNASHIQTAGSEKKYIAAQAPIQATCPDFWRVAWEQDIRVIVMLTAESEGGNPKCHPYWKSANYGPFKLKSLSEREVTLERRKLLNNRSFTAPLKVPQSDSNRPSLSRRHSSKHSISSPTSAKSTPPTDATRDHSLDDPHVIIRKLALSNTDNPFEPLREITQLHYSGWPDFGAPADPAHVLSLVEKCQEISRSYDQIPYSVERLQHDSRPVIVHCSAGCGRTGTFCTIDSVIDILKRQRLNRKEESDSLSFNISIQPRSQHISASRNEDVGVHDPMEIDPDTDPFSSHVNQSPQKRENQLSEENSLEDENTDLVAHTVANFRLQRLSMVQTLRQFVLCYESVLEWIAGETEVVTTGMGEGEVRK